MVAERLEVKLGPEHRRKLAVVIETRHAPAASIVREMIDAAYEEIQKERRKRLVELMASANIEDVPDPDELSRQLDQTHDIGDLY